MMSSLAVEHVAVQEQEMREKLQVGGAPFVNLFPAPRWQMLKFKAEEEQRRGSQGPQL